jgi:hypothetical protein
MDRKGTYANGDAAVGALSFWDLKYSPATQLREALRSARLFFSDFQWCI